MTTQTLDQLQKKSVLSRYQNVTVIGAGAIGLSWTALFLSNAEEKSVSRRLNNRQNFTGSKTITCER